MKVTIKDVAEKAGVAISTVSLVINQSPKVAEETRRKVEAAIREFNYRPNLSAQQLAGKLKGNIGFILTEDHFTRSEPFYTHIFLGAEFEARNHNVYILLTTVKNSFLGKKDVPRFLLDHNVDGILLAGRVPYNLIDYIRKIKVPFVLVDFFPHEGIAQAVLIDNFEAARQVVNYLIQHNRHKIVFIAGDIEHPSIRARYEGYLKALSENQIPLQPEIVIYNKPNTTFQYGYEGMLELINREVEFDAIFAANDALALGCMRALSENQIKIPEQVAVVGFDDVAAAANANPPLTTVQVQKEEMGILACKTLIEMIKTGKKSNTKILVPTNFVVRKST
jgi:LacI family transcriptional regulator